MTAPVFNIPLIKENIKSEHNKFIAAVGQMPDKIAADSHLLLQRMTTRIGAILTCFMEERIIDKCIMMDYGTGGDKSCICYKISKNGYDKSVFIWSDGSNISIKSGHYPVVSGLNFDEDNVIRDIDFENYDWLEFANILLHFIHKVIYARVQSYETKLFG